MKELLPETPPTVVGHGIFSDAILYLTRVALKTGCYSASSCHRRIFADWSAAPWSRTRPPRSCGRLPPCAPPTVRAHGQWTGTPTKRLSPVALYGSPLAACDAAMLPSGSRESFAHSYRAAGALAAFASPRR